MFYNHLRIFRRFQGFSLINLLGLSLSLACCLFIALWLQDELRTDRFHTQGKRIYRIFFNRTYPDGSVSTWWNAAYPLAQVLEDEVPEVDKAVLTNHSSGMLLSYQEQHIRGDGLFASSDFFAVFSFPLLVGDSATVLSDPYHIALSESMATRLFGSDWRSQNVLGQTVIINQDESLQVSGVYADPPHQSTLQFEYLLTMELNLKWFPWNDDFGNHNHQLYALLHADTKATVAEDKANAYVKKRAQNDPFRPVYWFFPFEQLYLHGNIEAGVSEGGRIEYVRMFTAVVLLVLILACINYTNLATARATRRMREIGVRKALGASRGLLIRQFLLESTGLVTVAFVLALLLVQSLLPYFNQLTDKELSIDYGRPVCWLLATGFVGATGLLAGSYPAFLLASFRPVRVLRGKLMPGTGTLSLRRTLVVVQFALSTVLIAGAMLIQRQAHFLLNKPLGLDKENLIAFPMQGGARTHMEAIKQQLLQHPSVVGVTGSNLAPLSISSSNAGIRWEGMAEGQQIEFSHMGVGYDFARTFGIPLVAGRDFSPDFSTDTANFIINETAARMMGLDDPVGTRVEGLNQQGKIIGVIQDYHNQLLYAPITPLMMYLTTPEMLFIKTAPGQTAVALAQLQDVHRQHSAAYPFEYVFPEDELHQLYRDEEVAGTLASYFAALAIIISCLGLLGLASFSAQQRTQEIGIRKVLGASVSSLLMLLSRDYVRLILIALAIAIPVANYLIQEWLQNFAYTVALPWWQWLLPVGVIVLLALATVSTQTFRAATRNPVDSLRDE